ncbi:MAG: cyclohexa-1,5-dienecarbonyl-CoA hydratase [Proteobacteria bacterium]|nr:cyclohexa-1,5-dienecarbonyl-CoA hydratase [Pseudomonadota bacterium]MCP4919392.1 cyclohexa-1,5-dienecarbonyl-CoA hydratase [Pseudomonadota bacterium]
MTRGVLTSEVLVAEGWQRRFLADESRAREAQEMYSSSGFEVHLQRLMPDDFGEKCQDCAASVCTSYVVVYTRKPEPHMISVTRHDSGVVHVTLDQPKANILDAAMIGAIRGLLAEIQPSDRLLVFEGSGDHFCFGASVEEHQKEQAGAMLEAFHGMFRDLGVLGIPTCAVVRGQCLGGGLELASWCTWIVCTPEARLGQPEIQLAVFPPMASLLLPWRCGGAAALDLCVSGRSWTAEEALNRGLASAVVEDPTAWWQELVAKRLSRTSASSLRFAEKAARASLLNALRDELPELERLYLNELMGTADANEGITAFLEKRRPAFTNC